MEKPVWLKKEVRKSRDEDGGVHVFQKLKAGGMFLSLLYLTHLQAKVWGADSAWWESENTHKMLCA